MSEPIKFTFIEEGLSSIKNNLGGVKTALAAIGAGVGLKKMIDEAIEADDGITKLSTALRNAGTYSKQSVTAFENFASKMQQTTRFSDDASISLINLYRNMTALSNNQIKTLTERTADLAVVMGVDLNTAGQMVMKTIEGNSGALKRYGITVKEGSDETARLNNFLDATSKFASSAEEDLNTYSGSLAFINNNFNNMAEAIGKALIKSDAFRTSLSWVMEASKGASEWIDKLLDPSDKETLTQKLADANKELDDLQKKAATTNLSGNLFKLTGMKPYEESIKKLKNEIGGLELQLQSLTKTEKANQEEVAKIDEKKGITISENTKLYEEQMKKIADLQKSVENAGLSEIMVLQKTRSERLKSLDEGLVQGVIKYNDANKLQLQIETDFQQKRFEIEQKGYNDIFALRPKEVVNELTFGRKKLLNMTMNSAKENTIEYAANEQRIQNLSDTFDTIASLTSSSNRTLFEIGKLASASTATVDGIVAVQKALASAPPPYNFALAGIVGVATALNVAKIMSSSFGSSSGSAVTSGGSAGTGPTGTGAPAVTVSGNLGGMKMATGGYVPPGFPNDSFPARLTSGEFVVNTTLAKKLDALADEKRQGEQNSKMQEVFGRIMNTNISQTFNFVQSAVDKIKNIAGKYNTGAFGSGYSNLDFSKFGDIEKLKGLLEGIKGFNNMDMMSSNASKVGTWQGSTNAVRQGLLANEGIGYDQASSDYGSIQSLMQQIVNEGNRPTIIQSDVKVNNSTFANINFKLSKNGNRVMA